MNNGGEIYSELIDELPPGIFFFLTYTAVGASFRNLMIGTLTATIWGSGGCSAQCCF
jgi:hypothetical protein